jgi:hypothetical protein
MTATSVDDPVTPGGRSVRVERSSELQLLLRPHALKVVSVTAAFAGPPLKTDAMNGVCKACTRSSAERLERLIVVLEALVGP